MRRELVHGNFEASILDMNRLCMTPTSSLKTISSNALARLKDMGYKYQR